MSKKNQKISVNKLESSLNMPEVTEILLWGTEDVIIKIKNIITLPEMLSFVKEVVEACIDGETGEYLPEAYDFAIRTSVLTRYANFAMPTNLEKQYWLVYKTSAFSQVVEHIDECQFNDIIRAIDKKINFMLNIMSSAAVTKINEVISKFNEIAEAGGSFFGEENSSNGMADFINGVAKLSNMKEEDIARAIVSSKVEEE